MASFSLQLEPGELKVCAKPRPDNSCFSFLFRQLTVPVFSGRAEGKCILFTTCSKYGFFAKQKSVLLQKPKFKQVNA